MKAHKEWLRRRGERVTDVHMVEFAFGKCQIKSKLLHVNRMETSMKRISSVVLLLVSWSPAHAQGQPALPAAEVQRNCATTGKDSVADLHRDWLMIGWERDAGDPDFNFRTDLGRYYDFTRNDLSLFDDFDPKLQVRSTADDYGSIWYQFVPTFRSVHHKITEQPSPIAVGPGYSHSVLEFVFEVTPKKGDVMYLVSRSSILWRCSTGGWKIYREHNSAKPIQASTYKQAK